MSEKIIIENFGGIKKASIQLNRINIFIGPQASGKSVVAKLVYFFRTSIGNLIDGGLSHVTLEAIREGESLRFEKYFPSNNLGKNDFYLKYQINKESITIIKQQGKVNIEYSPKFVALRKDIEKLLDPEDGEHNKKHPARRYHEIILSGIPHRSVKEKFPASSSYRSTLIPTGRSFFAQVEASIFSLIQNKIPIDTFLINFGVTYESARGFHKDHTIDPSITQHIDQLALSILKGEYLKENKKDYIVHKDGRKVEAKYLSSGQQETLPLILILRQAAYSNSMVEPESMMLIEEPEASIFPVSQQEIVKLIATVFNVAQNTQHFLITTHSPYILTAFNNLIQAGLMIEEGIDKKKIHKIVPEFEVLKSGTVSAFLMKNGRVKNIMDKESGLIAADLIDEASENISLEFDKLMDLY